VDLTSNGKVACNQNATLTWTSTNATSCSASGEWSGTKAVSGAEAVGGFDGSRVFTLTCTGLGGSASDSVTLIGNNEDELKVDAGSDEEVDAGDSIRLDGNVDGDYDSLRWVCNGGDLSKNNTLRPTWEAPSDYDYEKTYTCTLTARNDCGSDSDKMRITVNPIKKEKQKEKINVGITKTVRNVSLGGSYQGTITANPLNIVSYQITVTGVSGTANNVIVYDNTPGGITNIRDLTVDGQYQGGDLRSGVNMGSISAGQTKTITYTATIANENSFGLGQNTINNTATVTTDGASANSSAAVIVNRQAVFGATSIVTGFDNNVLGALGIALIAALGTLLWVSRNTITVFFKKFATR
jgi:hypothetical protein